MTKEEQKKYNVAQRQDVYEAFNALTSEQQLQLERYAKKKAKSVSSEYSWKDLIQEVFARAYGVGGSGKNYYRNWPKDKCDLILFFKRVMDNIVDHYLRDFDRPNSLKRVVVDGGNSDNIGPEILLRDNDSLRDPELIIIEEENISEFDEYVNVLSNKDVNIGKILDCYLNGIWEPRKISLLMGVSIKEINNIQKRIRRDKKLKALCPLFGVKLKKNNNSL